MKSRSALKGALMGAFFGYFVLHPLLMCLGYLMTEESVITGHAFMDIIVKSFSLQMLLWSLSVSFFCALIGFLYGKIKTIENALRIANTELGKRIKNKTAELVKGNEELKREIADRKRAQAEIQRNYDIQSVLNNVLSLSLTNISLDEILKETLDLILSIPWLSFELKGSIFLVEDAPEILVMKTENSLPDILKKECARVPFGRCICGRAALKKKVVFVDCIDDRHDVSYENMPPHGHYCVPLLLDDTILGVINLYVEEGYEKNVKEEEFLKAIAITLVGVIKRHESEQKVQDTLENLRGAMGGSIQLLADTSEVRDPYTAGHQRRVADLARSIATEMGLTKDQIDGIRMAGVVHDIGKIAIPAEILSKPSRLTEIEFSLIKTHAQVAYDILKKIDFPWPVALIAYQHHERMDGSGYPQGLKGEEISLGARILAVADVVEAMAFHRPYRPAFGVDMALEEISNKKGIIYDPDAVDACLKIIREKGFKFK